MSDNLWMDNKTFDQINDFEPIVAIYNLHEDALCLQEKLATLREEVERLKVTVKAISKVNGGYCDVGVADSNDGCPGCKIAKMCEEALQPKKGE